MRGFQFVWKISIIFPLSSKMRGQVTGFGDVLTRGARTPINVSRMFLLTKGQPTLQNILQCIQPKSAKLN
jgi:hypothetical protein